MIFWGTNLGSFSVIFITLLLKLRVIDPASSLNFYVMSAAMLGLLGSIRKNKNEALGIVHLELLNDGIKIDQGTIRFDDIDPKRSIISTDRLKLYYISAGWKDPLKCGWLRFYHKNDIKLLLNTIHAHTTV